MLQCGLSKMSCNINTAKLSARIKISKLDPTAVAAAGNDGRIEIVE